MELHKEITLLLKLLGNYATILEESQGRINIFEIGKVATVEFPVAIAKLLS